METLKEEEEELKRKVEQCKVSEHLEFPGREGVVRAGTDPISQGRELKLREAM